MLVQIVTENGQKKIKPLTADAGAGLPVGFIAPAYKKGNYSGWLYLDGRDTTGTSEELSTHYPILYAFLGSNKLPDYREFALVGAEENTTDVYNASTNPNGTIHDHDVYTEGQAKDDQLQDHEHKVGDASNFVTYTQGTIQSGTTNFFNVMSNTASIFAKSITSGRHDTVTRGKRKAVYFYIKATSGLSENAQDNVLAQFKEYSNNQNLLSDYETFTLTDTNQQMQYDGFLLVRTKGTGPWGCTIYVNDIEVSTSYNNTVNYNTVITVTIPLNKGENVRYGGSAPDGTKARFYKLRDYTGR